MATFYYDELSPTAQDRAFEEWVERGGAAGDAYALCEGAFESVYVFFESLGVAVEGHSLSDDPEESFIKVSQRNEDIMGTAEYYGYERLGEFLVFGDGYNVFLTSSEPSCGDNWIGDAMSADWIDDILPELDQMTQDIYDKVDAALYDCGLDYECSHLEDYELSIFENWLKEYDVPRAIKDFVIFFNKSVKSYADRAAREISDEMAYYQTSRDYFEEKACDDYEFAGDGSICGYRY